MSRIKLLTIAVVGLIVINLALVAYMTFSKPGRPAKGRPPMENGGPKQLIIDFLHFNKGQVAQYENLIAQHQISVKSLDDSIRQAKNLLYQTLATGNNALKDSLVNTLGDLQQHIETVHYNHFAELKAICTPEQSGDFEKLTKELAAFFEKAIKGPGKEGRRPGPERK